MSELEFHEYFWKSWQWSSTGFSFGLNLFLIYMKDITGTYFKGKHTACADDTAVSEKNKDLNVICNQFKDNTLFLRHWFDRKNMILFKKTKYIIFILRGELFFSTPIVLSRAWL